MDLSNDANYHCQQLHRPGPRLHLGHQYELICGAPPITSSISVAEIFATSQELTT